VSLAAALAGCGSTTNRAAQNTITTQIQGVPARKCNGASLAKQVAQRARLDRDLRRLRLAVVTMKHYAQDGNAATNKALDRFMIDVGSESLAATVRNRYIDRAAAVVSPHCYLCFQTLESNRPLGAAAKLPCD
jgi:hypothetical protein